VHPLTVVLACVFLDTLGVGLIIPCLVQLFTSLGASPSQYGFYSSIYGIGQLVGSPICGALADRIGTKPILMMSFVGAGLSYGMMGGAWSLYVVVLARIMVGLVKQTQTVGIAYVVGVTDPNGRTQAMAWFSTASSVGFIFGPVTGSLLSRVNARYPFFLSAAIYTCTTLLAAVFLPNVYPDSSAMEGFDPTCPITGKAGECVASLSQQEQEQEQEEEKKKRAADLQENDASTTTTTSTPDAPKPSPRSPNPFVAMRETFPQLLSTLVEMVTTSNALATLVAVRFALSVSLMMMESTMLLYLQNRFDLDSKSNGFVLGFFGLTGVAINVFVVSRATRYFGGEQKTCLWAFVTGAVGFVIMGLSPSFRVFLVGVVIFCLGLYTSRACLLTLFTQMSPPTKRGAYLGVGGSLESLCRVVVPMVGGYVLEVDVRLPYLSCGVLMLCIALVWWVSVVRPQGSVGSKLPSLAPVKKTK